MTPPPARAYSPPGAPPRGAAARGAAARGAAARAAARGRSSQARDERGLPGWQALIVLLAICAAGGLFDVMSGSRVRGAFNVAIVVAAFVAILVVRRSAMFTIVVSPPIVYVGASAMMLFVRGGLSNRNALYDEAANWLVYGFPAIAGATAAVLLVAGVRLIIKR